MEINNKEKVADHIVGSMIATMNRDPKLGAIIFDRLSPDNMRLGADVNPSIVYSEMARLFKDPKEPYTFGALEAGLHKLGSFNFEYLANLQARIDVESVETLIAYADKVNNSAGLFMLGQSMNEAKESMLDPHADADEVKASLITSLTKAQTTGSSVHTSAQVGARLRKELDAIRSGIGIGRTTGIAAFDRVFTMKNGFLITLAMRPSQGKTSTFLQILFNVAQEIKTTGENAQVAFFTSDDTEVTGMQRMACAQAGVDSRKLENNSLSSDEWELFYQWLEYIESLPIAWDETPSPTGEHIYYRTAMLNAQTPVVLGAMDYVQLMTDPGARSETQEVRNSFTSLKGTAKILEFPMLAASQLGKTVENRADKFPTPSDMLHAGEAESDVNICGVRPEHYIARGEEIMCLPDDEEGVIVFNVGKNKGGAIGKVRVGYKKEWTRVFDLDKSGYGITPLN